jgi:hypothetical protein
VDVIAILFEIVLECRMGGNDMCINATFRQSGGQGAYVSGRAVHWKQRRPMIHVKAQRLGPVHALSNSKMDSLSLFISTKLLEAKLAKEPQGLQVRRLHREQIPHRMISCPQFFQTVTIVRHRAELLA